MAWEQELFALLDDLEQQASALYAAERSVEVADRSRAEYRSVTLASRLMASLDVEIAVDVAGIGPVGGVVDRVADGWCLLRGSARDWVVLLDAVTAVRGVSGRGVPEVAWPATARLGLASVLRGLAESAQPTVVHARTGTRYEGRVGRIGADFVELSAGEPARDVLLAFNGVAALSSSE